MTSEVRESFLTCPGCSRYFDKETHLPHVLPCLHTYCTLCLTSKSKKGYFQCFECNESFEASENGIIVFPVNSARQRAIDIHQIQNKNGIVYCDECVDNHERQLAVCHCKECEEFLCTQCSDAHIRTKFTKNHNILSFENSGGLLPTTSYPLKTCEVKEHRDKALEYFCNSDKCKIPVCSACVIKNHHESHHNVRNINEIYAEGKELIENRLQNAEKYDALLCRSIEDIGKQKQMVVENEKSTAIDIDHYFEELISMLNERKGDLKKKLKSKLEVKTKVLESQVLSLTVQKKKVEQVRKCSAECLRHNNASDFLQMKELILSRIDRLQNMHIDAVPRVTPDIYFKRSEGDTFERECKTLGRVLSSEFCLPNTEVKTMDVTAGVEQTPLIIILKDCQNRPLKGEEVDVKVEIVNDRNQRRPGHISKSDDSLGHYNVKFKAPTPGQYKGFVIIQGKTLTHDGFSFRASQENSSGFTSNYSDTDNTEKVETLTQGHSCRVNKANDDITCPEIKMNSHSLHYQNVLSSDGKTMFNQRGRRRFIRNRARAFLNFRGTTGTCSFGGAGKYYFEIMIQFFIKRSLRQDLIFEFGLCRKSDVDKYYTIDGHQFAYAICARKCHICRTVCLQAWNNKQRIIHSPITNTAPPGTTYKAIYGFFLDTSQKQLAISDVTNRKPFMKFKNIDVSQPLWPVFGLYNPDLVDSSMTIRSGEDINTILAS